MDWNYIKLLQDLDGEMFLQRNDIYIYDIQGFSGKTCIEPSALLH